MGTITTTDGTEIFYKDWGSGQPIVFSHGWPLSADDWDTQMLFFLQHGYRVIAHDRRGHGRSTQTGDGHDMDHYADDLAALTTHLDLQDAACDEIEQFGSGRAHGCRIADQPAQTCQRVQMPRIIDGTDQEKQVRQSAARSAKGNAPVCAAKSQKRLTQDIGQRPAGV